METPSGAKYAAGTIPAVVRDAIGVIAESARRKGCSVETFASFLEGTVFALSDRTLYRWVKAVEEGGTPMSAEKLSGNKLKVAWGDQMILAGWVLEMSDENTPIGLAAYVKQVKLWFNLDIDEATASRYMSKAQLTWQLTGSRPMPPGSTKENYTIEYFNFVKARTDDGFFSVPGHKLVCLDFFTDSRRVERVRTFAGKGGKQKKFARLQIKYTNSYLGGLWRDGINRTPVLMFTYNIAFGPNSKVADRVEFLCQLWKIDRDRIFYTFSKRYYCKEQLDQVSTFWDRYKCLRGAHVMHDKGNSFKEKGVYVELDYGAARVEVFPAICHGELSVNDHWYHSMLKALWRSQRSAEGDEVYDQLLLLHLSDTISPEDISAMFNHNYLLDVPKLKLADVETLLAGPRGINEKRDRLHDDCQEAYLDYLAAFPQEQVQEVPVELQADLGPYWSH
jgi:hypothetical protein